MANVMPQEIEVWYVIPALRRELSKIFTQKHNLTQKKAAELLGLTESAVSQYLKEKRGGELKFSEKELEMIEQYAKKMIADKDVMRHMYALCVKLRGSARVCALHRKHDGSVGSECDICMQK